MRHRHELTDDQWARLEPLLPAPKRGPQPRDRRRLLNGILWIHATGAQWRDLPERYGPWETVASQFYRWEHAGVWGPLLEALQQPNSTPTCGANATGRRTSWTGPSSAPSNTRPAPGR